MVQLMYPVCRSDCAPNLSSVNTTRAAGRNVSVSFLFVFLLCSFFWVHAYPLSPQLDFYTAE